MQQPNTGKMKSGMEEGSEKATAAISNLKSTTTQFANEFADKAQHVASDVAAKAQEYGEVAVDKTTTLIRQYPVQALLAGFGVGILIGLGLSRR
jgi:ElaB/YqjD/DUF883 family membrane-anchored ribosome-binding protein